MNQSTLAPAFAGYAVRIKANIATIPVMADVAAAAEEAQANPAGTVIRRGLSFWCIMPVILVGHPFFRARGLILLRNFF